MNKETKTALALLCTTVVLFITTLLLEITWIKAMVVRQVMVYALLCLAGYIGFRNIQEINKK